MSSNMKTEYTLVSSAEFGRLLNDYSDADYRRLRTFYDDFLQQPLQLGQFVPCDEEGKPMNEPCIGDYSAYWNEGGEVEYNKAFDKYAAAKDRVMFEGVELHPDGSYRIGATTIANKEETWYNLYFSTIEEMANFGLKPTLTQSAIKKIGL